MDADRLLTERELEVAALVGLGFSVKKIAQELELAEATVYTHINNMARKLPGHTKPYRRVLLYMTSGGGARIPKSA